MLSPFNSVTRRPFGVIESNQGSINLQPQISRPVGNKSEALKKHTLRRVLNFYADYSGCGHWRMIWPEQLLKASQKLNIAGSTVMVSDPAFFREVKTVRVQRQATSQQKQYFKFLKEVKKENNMNLIYEIDDIIFHEDIPDYNKFKTAFDNPEIRKTSMEIMQMADEMTVTNQFMKEYFKDKTGHERVTVIPNFVPKFWMDRFYNKNNIITNYTKNKKKPRILYCGSGAHFDVDQRVKNQDDFYLVNDVIRKTIDDFQWVFFGGFPLPLADLVHSGKIEFHTWEGLMNYPYKIHDIKCQLMYAPLADNTFNKAKSDLKFIEGCCMGIPTICQDIVTYSNAPYKFTTGAELIDQIKHLTSDQKTYLEASTQARKFSNNRWLEDNIGFYEELYRFPYGHPNRKNLNRLNKIVVK